MDSAGASVVDLAEAEVPGEEEALVVVDLSAVSNRSDVIKTVETYNEHRSQHQILTVTSNLTGCY